MIVYFSNLALSAGAEHMIARPLYLDQLSVIMVLIVGLVAAPSASTRSAT